MKVHAFESEPWIKAAWQSTGTKLDAVWIEGLLTQHNTAACRDATIISIDMSVLHSVVLSSFKNLELIAVRATGVDQIDLDYCRERGITVCSVPGYAGNAVAEHVFALLLTISRHVAASSRQTRQLNFSCSGLQGFELCGKTMAVIGTGAIGRRVALIAKGFGMRVVVYDNYPDEGWARQNTIVYQSLEDALGVADVISLHVPGTEETRHLISAARFRLMKDGVVIINTARGAVVDSHALLEALTSGKVSAAGLDVLPEEYDLLSEDARLKALAKDRKGLSVQLANHLLLQHPNVLVTPHCAFFTREAAERLMSATVGNIEAFIAGRPTNRVV